MNLANQKPKDTYKGILTLTDNAGLTTTLKAVGDGNGGYSPLQLSTTQVAIKAPSFDLGMLDIYESQSVTIEYSGIRMRRADGVIRWQLISDNTGDFSIYSGSNKSFSIPAAMQNVYAIGLSQPLDATLRAFTTGAATSPLQLSTTQVQVTGTSDVPSVNVGIFKVLGSATNALVFGTTTSSPFGAYIQGGGSARYPLLLNPLLNANAGVSIGKTTNGAALDVKGDGTNPIARFESSAGANFFTINNSGQTIWGSAGANEPYIVNYNGTSTESSTGQSLRIRQRANTGSTGNTLIQYWADGLFSGTTSGTAISHEFVSSGFLGSGAGNANYRHSTHAYTINNSAAQTGTATGIFLNATETALNGMTHNLMDLQTTVSSVSTSRFIVGRTHDVAFRFNNIAAANNWRPLYSISRVGGVATPAISFGVGSGASGSSAYIASSNDDLYLGTDTSSTFTTNIILKANSVGFIGLGGLTSSFPAIKRNGAAINFVTADGAANSFVDIVARQYTSYYGAASGFQIHSSAATALTGFTIQSYNTTLGGKILTLYSTSIFEADATAGGGVTLRGSGDTHTAEASALFAMKSITKGFLPPRMDDTEVRAIPSPAEGLVVFNTDITHLCIFASGTWHKLSQSTM
jgi:hypothetical protein